MPACPPPPWAPPGRERTAARRAQRRCGLLATLALAAPLVAQSFGQGFVAELEPNATAATASPLGGTNVVGEGQIVGGTEVDFWSFGAGAGDSVYAAVVTASSAQSFNAELELIAADGVTVLETDLDDGSLSSLAPSIAGATIASGGTYYLRVRSQSPGSSTEIRPYRLYLRVQSGAPSSEEEPNDATPQAVPTSGWIAGNLDEGELDLFSLALAAGDTVFASLDADPERDGGTTYDPRLGVGELGASATTLVVDDLDTTSPNSEAIALTVQSAGTYRIFVDESGGNGGAGATYRLSVSVLPATAQGATCTTYASSDVPQTIADGPGSTTSTVTIPGHPRIADLDLSLVLDHAQPADLDVHLVSPAGNDDAVVTDVGSALFPDWDVTFDDESAAPVGAYPLAVVADLGLQPESSYRLDWFDGEDAGGDWTLVLDDDAAANGGTLTSWSLRICEPVALPTCPEGTTRQSFLTADFEAGDSGFTHSGTQDEWELGPPTSPLIDGCASGSSCWGTDLDDTYNSSSNQLLVSPAVDLAGAVGPVVVSWAQKYQMENATFDKYTVELALAGGTNPETLFAWRGPDMSTTAGAATLQESAGWGLFQRTAGAAFDGQNVELRFRVTSDSSANYDGVAIDDVEISACVPISNELFSDGFDTTGTAGTVCAWSSAVGSTDDCGP